MNFPTKDTTFGEVIYKDKRYKLLSSGLLKIDNLKRILEYKKRKCNLFSSAPWSIY